MVAPRCYSTLLGLILHILAAIDVAATEVQGSGYKQNYRNIWVALHRPQTNQQQYSGRHTNKNNVAAAAYHVDGSVIGADTDYMEMSNGQNRNGQHRRTEDGRLIKHKRGWGDANEQHWQQLQQQQGESSDSMRMIDKEKFDNSCKSAALVGFGEHKCRNRLVRGWKSKRDLHLSAATTANTAAGYPSVMTAPINQISSGTTIQQQQQQFDVPVRLDDGSDVTAAVDPVAAYNSLLSRLNQIHKSGVVVPTQANELRTEGKSNSLNSLGYLLA